MGKHRIQVRFALSVWLWTAAWSCMVVALTKTGEPWPWGGIALFLAAMAATATAAWALECTALREVRTLRAEVEELRHDRDALPGILAESVARALAVRRVGG